MFKAADLPEDLSATSREASTALDQVAFNGLCRQVHFGLCIMALCSPNISTQVLAISWTPGHNVQENSISAAVLQEQKH